jgi:hypothetical protein
MPSEAAVTANELAALAANKPLIVADNVLRRATAFRWTSTGVITAPDLSDIDHLPSKAFDGHLDVETFPAVALTTNYYLNFTIPGNEVFDSLILKPTIVPSVCTLNVGIDDDPAWGSPIIIHTSVLNSANRLIDIDLTSGVNGNRRFTDYQNIRLHFTAGAAFACPRIGEFILGRRRQLSSKAWYPYDAEAVGSEGSQFKARGRKRKRHVYAKGFTDVQGTWVVHDGDYGLDDVITIRTLWEECDYGNENVIYIEDPATNPTLALFSEFQNDAELRELRMPKEDVTERRWEVDLAEQPPFARRET